MVGAGDIVEAAGHPVGGGVIKEHYDPRLTNEDLAPLANQSWSTYNIFAFWMSDVHSVGGYVTAGSLFALGLASWQVLIALLVGIVIVYFLCNLVAKPSQQAGVPYPVVCRSPFGVLGANIPAIIRGLIAVAWYGIQTYLASAALDVVLLKLFPGLAPYADVDQYGFTGLSLLGWGSFTLLWILQAAVFWRGMESIRKFIDFCGPAVYVVMFILCGYLLWKSGWHVSLNLGGEKKGNTLVIMLGAIALVVSYFSGPMLNFGDFARYGKSFQAVKKGNFLGLPVNFLVFSLLVVITAAATVPVFGELLTDPVADRRPDRQRDRNRVGRVDVHHRHHRHQHRGQLHLARVRLLERQPAEDQLADGRHDRRRRFGAADAVEPVQQPGGHPLHAGDPRRLHRPAVRRAARGLLPGAQAEDRRRRPVHDVEDRRTTGTRVATTRLRWSRRSIGAVLAMAPVLLGGIVFGMAGASQYSWFIGCGVAFALYYLLATRGPWKMTALRVPEGATLVENG